MADLFDSNHIVAEDFNRIDDYVNSFIRIKDVSTHLMYGEPSLCTSPLLSVIIPTYNRKELLNEAIQSVLKQKEVDYDYEIIVIDNTPFLSDDMATYALQLIHDIDDPKILYYHNEKNIGSGYNWNRGVELSRGKWICFLHDDDILLPSALYDIGYMIKNAGLVEGKKPLGYIHARRDGYGYSSTMSKALSENIGCYKRLSRVGCLINGHTGTGCPSCGTVILKEAYIKNGGINYSYGPTADAILGYKIMKNYLVIRSNEVLGYYRWNCNESVKPDTIRKLVYSDYLFQKYREQLSCSARIWGKIFGSAQFFQNVKSKLSTPGLEKGVLSKDEFYVMINRKHVNWLSAIVLSIIQFSYRLLSFIDGFVRYRKVRKYV